MPLQQFGFRQWECDARFSVARDKRQTHRSWWGAGVSGAGFRGSELKPPLCARYFGLGAGPKR